LDTRRRSSCAAVSECLRRTAHEHFLWRYAGCRRCLDAAAVKANQGIRRCVKRMKAKLQGTAPSATTPMTDAMTGILPVPQSFGPGPGCYIRRCGCAGQCLGQTTQPFEQRVNPAWLPPGMPEDRDSEAAFANGAGRNRRGRARRCGSHRRLIQQRQRPIRRACGFVG